MSPLEKVNKSELVNPDSTNNDESPCEESVTENLDLSTAITSPFSKLSIL